MLDVFEKTLQKTMLWLKELMDELGWADQHKAYVGLRAVLQTLRDRLPVEEAVELGAQLPMLIRGLYYEGWRPAGKPVRIRAKEDFVVAVEDNLADPSMDGEEIARAVFKVLARRVTEGEIQDIRSNLPRQLQELWPEMTAGGRKSG